MTAWVLGWSQEEYADAAAKYPAGATGHPAWPPSLDSQSDFARMLYTMNGFYGSSKACFVRRKF
jgi:hypothetical protein